MSVCSAEEAKNIFAKSTNKRGSYKKPELLAYPFKLNKPLLRKLKRPDDDRSSI